MSIAGALIGAGANLLGGLLGKKQKSAYRNTRDAMIARRDGHCSR